MFRHTERMVDPRTEGYVQAAPETLIFRRITDAEFQALPAKYTSTARIILSVRGAAALFSVIFALGSAFTIFADHTPDKAVKILIFGTVSLFMLVFSFVALYIALHQRITPDAMVVPGEIIAQYVHRGARGARMYTVYTVALHGSQQSVQIRESRRLSTGSTVLIVRQFPAPYLAAIPEYAADYAASANARCAQELPDIGSLADFDPDTAQKISFRDLQTHPLPHEDYTMLPAEVRCCRPLRRGLASAVWVSALILTVICFVWLRSAAAQGQSETAGLAGGILIVTVFLLLFLIPEVFRRPLKDGHTVFADGIVTEKHTFSGRYFIAAVFPGSGQYVQEIETDKHQYAHCMTGARVRFHFRAQYEKPYAFYISLPPR